jgi:peptide deformylase
MILKKADLKLVLGNNSELYFPPEVWDFKVDGDGEMLANLLFDRMKELGGIGLSANQVSVPRRVFVIGMNEFRKAFFNPEIIRYSKVEVTNEEGCLSFPGMFLMVKRPENITIKYQNEKGEWFEEEYIGLSSKVIQHEYDHMQGKTFKSRVSSMKWNMATKKKDKKVKRIIKEHVQKQLIDIHKKMEQGKNVDNSTGVS